MWRLLKINVLEWLYVVFGLFGVIMIGCEIFLFVLVISEMFVIFYNFDCDYVEYEVWKICFIFFVVIVGIVVIYVL